MLHGNTTKYNFFKNLIDSKVDMKVKGLAKHKNGTCNVDNCIRMKD